MSGFGGSVMGELCCDDEFSSIWPLALRFHFQLLFCWLGPRTGWLVRAPPPQYGVADNVERHQRTPTFNAFSGQGRALPADTDDEK